MKFISKENALAVIKDQQEKGYHIDPKVELATAGAKALFSLTIDDQQTLLSLVMANNSGHRFLTPKKQARTLLAVTERLLENNLHLSDLAHGNVDEEYNPVWFRPCVEIDAQFDYERFGWVYLTFPAKHHLKYSPGGTFRIYDGNRKCLVLGKRLLAGETSYKKIPALLIVPKPFY